jgi:hypothetical protein
MMRSPPAFSEKKREAMQDLKTKE